MKENTRSRGFASMDAEKQREIARKGGKAAHERGTAHEFTPEEAREAGRRGGERVSHDRTHMANIGRMGGKSSAARRRGRAETTQPGQTPEPRPEQRPEQAAPGQEQYPGQREASHEGRPEGRPEREPEQPA